MRRRPRVAKTSVPSSAGGGVMDRGQAHQRIDSVRPSGYTPISLALQKAAALLPADGKQAVVLVADGEDTCGTPPCDVATADAFGPVRLGMTLAQAQAAVGSSGTASLGNSPHCQAVTCSVNGGQASATVHDKEAAIVQITTPPGTKTDRGVGDGSPAEQVTAAYSRDHAVKQETTQAGEAIYLTTGDPSRVGFGNPVSLDRVRDQRKHGGSASRRRRTRV